MNPSILRWGILGPAGIARKNWQAIRLSGNGTLVAVASRDAARARAFIAECQAAVPFETAPRALGSYEELIAAPDVDAIYIPLPTGVREEWIMRAAEAGKHVISEKPCAVNATELRRMLDTCARHRVQFMDGVMFRHNARLARMRAMLDDGESVGALRRITSSFTFAAPPEFFGSNIRTLGALEPFGCLGDLGWYCLQISLWAAGWRLPHTVTGRLHAVHGDVPTEFSGELLFDGGLSAGFDCSFLLHNQQWANFAGTKGSLRVDDFALPFAGTETAFERRGVEFRRQGCDFRFEPRVRRITVAEHSHGHETAQEACQFRHFAAQVLSGALDQSWPAIALQTQQVMDACLASARAGGQPITLG
ncbi:MAG: Gfo/Idh/MocA family oxidoreductase [Verrucomicrobiota bacterium]